MSVLERGPNLGEQVYAVVRERIVSGDYGPGAVINESELAATLDVSRTPVSNALIMLRERGLVEARQGRLSVRRLSLHDVRDLFVCRGAFDGLATRLAAQRVTDADLDALSGDLEVWAAVERDDAQALWLADLGFHARIYALSGNDHLVRFAEIATDLLAVYRHASIRRLLAHGEARSTRSSADVDREHRAILAALAQRDPDAAEAAARRHIEHVVTHLSMLDLVTATDDEADAAPPDAARAPA